MRGSRELRGSGSEKFNLFTFTLTNSQLNYEKAPQVKQNYPAEPPPPGSAHKLRLYSPMNWSTSAVKVSPQLSEPGDW